MENPAVAYYSLLSQFLSGKMSVDEFRSTFLEWFKSEGQLDISIFELLDELFGDVDSFTLDQRLLAENPGFYLDEAGLREKAQVVACRLAVLTDNTDRRK